VACSSRLARLPGLSTLIVLRYIDTSTDDGIYKPLVAQDLNGFLDRSNRDTVGLNECPLGRDRTASGQPAGPDLLAEDIRELLIDGYRALVVDLTHSDQAI